MTVCSGLLTAARGSKMSDLYKCNVLITSVSEGRSLVKMRESCPTCKSPEGHAHSTNVFICYGFTHLI